MYGNTVHIDYVVLVGVDCSLRPPPVEFVDPVVYKLLKILPATAVIPVIIPLINRPSSGFKPVFELCQLAFRDMDWGWLQ
jgi:hypothetical protein